MSTGYAWDKVFLGHETGVAHRERPDRVANLDHAHVSSALPGLVPVRMDWDLAQAGIRRVHDLAYVERVSKAFERGEKRIDPADTVVRHDTYDVAVGAVAASLSVTRSVIRGQVSNGFAACRPPGHHARAGSGRFFCYFNNVAICARYAQNAGFQKVLIVDWDVHPADGTSSIFVEDPDVYVLSVHQAGIFTETCGAVTEVGRGPGEGTTRNVPLPPRSDPQTYLRELGKALDQTLRTFVPDVVLVSCGFDAHRGDPIGNMALDDDAFTSLTRMVRDVADQSCDGRLVSLLEGGYQKDIVERCTRRHLAALMD